MHSLEKLKANSVWYDANLEPRDYTKWRERHMYIGESVRETAVRAKAAAARLEETTMSLA